MNGVSLQAVLSFFRYEWPAKTDCSGMVMRFSSIKWAITRVFSVCESTFLCELSTTHKSKGSAPMTMMTKPGPVLWHSRSYLWLHWAKRSLQITKMATRYGEAEKFFCQSFASDNCTQYAQVQPRQTFGNNLATSSSLWKFRRCIVETRSCSSSESSSWLEISFQSN